MNTVVHWQNNYKLITKEFYRLQGLVPLKWMAIESIRDSIYTEKTDM